MDLSLGHKIGIDEIPTGVNIDIQRVLEGRLLIVANSGGGKSYTIRKFMEVTHGKVQQILIDIEGEFSSLREKFDYVLVGRDGDIPINLRAAELLARRLLELNTSAIIDLYELKHHERKRFVRIFLESLINLPKELWHPCLIIIDECHVLAPESKSGEAESLDAVKDLATRGRKRGYTLVACSQRISKLNKDVVAELNTKLIGRSSLDIDMKRAAWELGFTEKNDILSLRTLNKGEFYAFGPALTNEVTKIKIDQVQTTHQEPGKKYQQIKSAPAEKVRRVLEKLKDLPVEAEEELKTKDDLKRKIIELQRDISGLKRQKPEQKQIIDKELLNKYYETGFNNGVKRTNDRLPKIIPYIKYSIRTVENMRKQSELDLKKLFEDLSYLQGAVEGLSNPVVPVQPVKVYLPYGWPNSKEAESKNPQQLEPASQPESKLREGAMRMLKAVAMYHPTEISKNQVATLSGFSAGGGTFLTYLSELKRAGWINIQGDNISITEEGLTNAGPIDPLSTDSNTLIEMWCSKFRDGVGKMLRVIASCYPDGILKEELAERTGFSAEGGTFLTYLSELKRNGLIEISSDMAKATKELFP